MTNDKFDNLFGQKVRDSKKENLTQFHMDIAANGGTDLTMYTK